MCLKSTQKRNNVSKPLRFFAGFYQTLVLKLKGRKVVIAIFI